jgi:hypothetical protein
MKKHDILTTSIFSLFSLSLGVVFLVAPILTLAQNVTEGNTTNETVTNETVTNETLPPEEVDNTADTGEVSAPAPLTAEETADLLEKYRKYSLFLKSEKYEVGKYYVRYRELAAKYPWEASKKTLKKIKESLKKDAKKYKKDPSRYASLATRASDYKNFDAMRNEFAWIKGYAPFASYAQYAKPEYANYKSYGTAANKAGYEAALVAATDGLLTLPTDAEIDITTLGPNITVGIYNMTPADLRNSAFRIRANRPFTILSKNNNFVATIPADVRVAVKYIGDKNFEIRREDTGALIDTKNREIRFVPTAEYQTETVFDVNRPGSAFDRYRDGIRLRYYDSPEADGDRVWVINVLPLEHYVWGMGEITGTGPVEYNRVMTTIYRTYGQWKVLWSTRYADMGFKVDATSGSQVYYGYDWEITHPRIREAAEITRGRVITYGNEVALTPYSS